MAQFALKIQSKYSKGWRKESSKLGQLFNVERAFQTIRLAQPFLITHWSVSKDLEMESSMSFIYRVRGDRAKLKIGDQLVGTDPESKFEQSAKRERYTIVSMRLLRDNIAVRTDVACTVYRPRMSIPPGNIPSTYSIQTPRNSQILAFNPLTGVWGFIDQPPTTGFITTVWTGITLEHRPDYEIPTPTPHTTKGTAWVLSLGQLPGVTFTEADLFIDDDGDWYRVDRPYAQIEAASINQLHATRVRI